MQTRLTVCAALMFASAAGAAELWQDSFEQYAPGPLAGQGGWAPWNDDPGAAGFEVVTEQWRDDAQALAIDGIDDAVRTYDGYDTGTWGYSAWILVPEEMDDLQYFVLLNTYPASLSRDWSLQLEIDGTGGVVRDFDDLAVSLPLVRGTWSKIAVIIDLEMDQQTVFYEGQLLLEKSWTAGVEPGRAPRIQAVDLWGNGSAHTVFYDTMFLEPLAGLPACPADFDGDQSIGFSDLLSVLAAWGPCLPECPQDLDDSGDVGFSDVLTVLASWGPCPRLGCVTDTVGLDETGSWTVPDWNSGEVMKPYAVDPLQFSGPVTVTQDPLPGSVFAGEQTVDVQFVATDTGDDTVDCVMPVELVDADPPTITILGVATGEVYVAPDIVLPDVLVTDEIDPAPLLEATLNDEPYLPGSPISEVGVHVLRVRAIDADGNVGSADAVVFEIAEFPRQEAVGVVAEMIAEDAGTGFWSLDTTILLASHEFDVRDLNLYSLSLWALNEHGFPLNRAPIHLAGYDSPGGGYDFTTVEALYQNGYWALRFVVDPAEESLIDAPAWFEITATGRHQEPGEFDATATFVAIVDPDPIGTLDESGLINDDPEEPAPKEAEWAPCKWKRTLTIGPSDTSSGSGGSCFGGVQHWAKYLWAYGGHFQGFSSAIDECTGNATASASVTSNAIMRVFLEGPAGCCDCEIECIFQPKFTAKVKVNGPGNALGAGMIDLASTCNCNTRAVGALGVGSGAPTTVTFGAGATVNKDGPQVGANVSVTTTIADSDEDEETFTGNCVGIVQKCSIVISIVTNARLKVKADAGLLDWYASANANLYGTSPGITVTAKCKATEGPCVGVTAVYTYK